MGVARSVWLQPTVTILAENELLDDIEQCSIVANLAVWRHGHVSLSGKNLAAIAEKGPQPTFGYFQAAAAYLGGVDADMRSHILAALSAMELLWNSSLSFHEQDRCAGHMFGRLISGRVDWQAILSAIEQRLIIDARQGGSSKRSLDYFRAWCRGHFYMVA
jgi:hypothetical protein